MNAKELTKAARHFFRDSNARSAGLVMVLLPAMLLLSGSLVHAQNGHAPDPLFKTIEDLDTRLFDAYNHCDLAVLGSMVSDDLEFYHDQTGLTTGKAPFLAAIQQNICGKVERALLKDTLEVYPLATYGAVEIGIHRFRHPAHPEEGMGDAKFVMLWQNRSGAWKLTRVISYEHNKGLLAK